MTTRKRVCQVELFHCFQGDQMWTELYVKTNGTRGVRTKLEGLVHPGDVAWRAEWGAHHAQQVELPF